MAELADGRVYKRKRIKDPTDENNYIDIPVLYEAKFKTIQEQAQETFLYFNNSSTSSRKTHIKRVTNNQDASQYIDVERIDEWTVKTMAEQAQERTFVLRNTDPPPRQPDGSNNPAHEKTHIVRYYGGNVGGENSPWVDVELIDELKISCAAEQYQEWHLVLRHPELNEQVVDQTVPYSVTAGFCDPSFPLAQTEINFDPPYRLDIFQNIINCNFVSEPPTGASVATLWCKSQYPFSSEPHLDHHHYLFPWYLQRASDPPPVVSGAAAENYYDAGNIGQLTWDQYNLIYYNVLTIYAFFEAALMALNYPDPISGKIAIIQITISDNTA